MFLGLDLGGSKLECRVFNDKWQNIGMCRTPVAGLCYQETLQVIHHSVSNLRVKYGKEKSIGLAAPGVVDPLTGMVKNAPSSPINGHDLASDIQSTLAAPVFIVNDANAFVFSEAFDGAAQGGTVVFGAILGTGVGGGVVVNGELLNGANGVAGEWGHSHFSFFDSKKYPDFSNLVFQCPCGELNHIEAFLSGRSLERIYKQLSGVCLKSEDILSGANSSDSVARRVFEFYIDVLAQALASVVNLLDPDVIVLGGGMSNIKEVYNILPLIVKYSFSDDLRTKLVPPKYGDASGAKGAAQLAWLKLAR